MIRDFHDVLAALAEARAIFLVVGAHALSAHGVPRATVDLDIWVRPDAENAAKVYKGLADFGAPLEDLQVTQGNFTESDSIVQFGLPPYRIDILTAVSGVTFDEAWADRIECDIEGVRVPVLGRKSFIQNKRWSGRKKDLADLESLGER